MEWWPVVAVAVIGLATPKTINYVARAIAHEVVKDIGDQLQLRWKDDIAEAVEPIDERLRAIEGQLTANGGESLFDKVNRISRYVEGKRFSDPEGTPQGF